MNTLTTAYDAASRLEGIADNFASYAYTLDNLGRATNIAQSLATAGGPLALGFSQQFDLSGNRTQLAATVNGTADFVNDYTFDGLNRNTRLTQAAQGSGPGFNAVAEKRVDLAYNALGQFDLITRYASLDTSALVATSDYAYDSLARLDLLTHQRADSSVINSYDFGYDSLNRITSLNQAIDGLSSFTYDTTNQLTAADHATQTDENYSYDLNGNRTDAGNVAGAANRLLEDATFVYEYDAEGNTTRQTRKATAAANDFITEFAWDHRNRLVEVTQKNNSGETTVRVEYDYDVTDHMIGRREFLGNSSTPARSEHFVWDGWNIALILDGAGAVVERRFNGDAADQVFASEDALNEVTWLLADHLNTPRDFLDSAGTLLNHRVYDSFGLITSETNSSVGSNIAFTGGYRDTVTNLVYRWHRWYSPHTHRWLSEDWIEDDLKNSYRYVGNRGMDRRDRTGLADELSDDELREMVIRNLNRLIEEDIRQQAEALAERKRSEDQWWASNGYNGFDRYIICKDTVWEAAMKSIADTDDARKEAMRIARALKNTIMYNWKTVERYSPYDERFQGYYCFDWAYALESAVQSESSGKYFDVNVHSASVESDEGEFTMFGARVHFWIRVINKTTGKSVYFDDSFCNRQFAHQDRPIPKGYSANNGPVTDIPRSKSNPPPSYDADGNPTGK